VRIVTYSAEDFDRLSQAAAKVNAARSLRHRPFVDYYYATQEWCRLYLVVDGDDRVAAAMGLEHLRFEYDRREVTLGCASNLVTFEPGAGGYLFLLWMRASHIACLYGGSADTHRLVRSQKWTYFPGVKVYRLNARARARPAEPLWRRAAKSMLRAVAPGVDIAAHVERSVMRDHPEMEVRAERRFTNDLLPDSGSFVFRFAPTTAYLNWRYSTELSFVRYRLYRILTRGRTSGYVVVNERPERLLVAQADGVDPDTVALGILLAIARVAAEGARTREVILTSAHGRMQEIFTGVGFRSNKADRPFVLTSTKGALDFRLDTSDWLVNFDWTDNGLRAPFLDEDQARRVTIGSTARAPESRPPRG